MFGVLFLKSCFSPLMLFSQVSFELRPIERIQIKKQPSRGKREVLMAVNAPGCSHRFKHDERANRSGQDDERVFPKSDERKEDDRQGPCHRGSELDSMVPRGCGELL